MKKLKYFGVMCCAITLAFTLAACSGTKEDSAAEILATANQKVLEAKSMETETITNLKGTLTYQGQSINLDSNVLLSLSMFSDPIKIKVNAITKSDASELKEDMYIVQKDSNYNLYYHDGSNWTVQPVNVNYVEKYNPKTGLQIYLKNGETFQKVGEETIKDRKAIKYTGVMKGEAMEELVKSSGMLEALNLGEGLNNIDLNALFSDIGDIPVSVWINEEGYPIRYEVDMKDTMNKMYEKLLDQMGEKVEGMIITCSKVQANTDCFNYNKATDFELPQEALQ